MSYGRIVVVAIKKSYSGSSNKEELKLLTHIVYYVPDSVLSTLYVSTHLILKQNIELDNL